MRTSDRGPERVLSVQYASLMPTGDTFFRQFRHFATTEPTIMYDFGYHRITTIIGRQPLVTIQRFALIELLAAEIGADDTI